MPPAEVKPWSPLETPPPDPSFFFLALLFVTGAARFASTGAEPLFACAVRRQTDSLVIRAPKIKAKTSTPHVVFSPLPSQETAKQAVHSHDFQPLAPPTTTTPSPPHQHTHTHRRCSAAPQKCDKTLEAMLLLLMLLLLLFLPALIKLGNPLSRQKRRRALFYY